MSAIIEIQNLSKQYRNRFGPKAVDGVNLEVQEGDIFGFVGPNGSGKTSTIRMMCTLLKATQGDIRVAGHSAFHQPRQVRRVIGYMPDYFGVYNDMLVWEYLDFFGACYHIPAHTRTSLIKDLLELVELSHRRDDPVESLSRGMKQRLSLARTLIHDPQVLILDEPASGLDPRARIEFRQLLVELASMGKTIFFSTHILADVAEICTRVGIMEAGKLVASGPLEELGQALLPHRTIHITVLDQSEAALVLVRAAAGIQQAEMAATGTVGAAVDPSSAQQADHQPPVRAAQAAGLHAAHPHGIAIQAEFTGSDEELSQLLTSLVQAGIPLLYFSEDTRDMEEVFMRATRGLVT